MVRGWGVRGAMCSEEAGAGAGAWRNWGGAKVCCEAPWRASAPEPPSPACARADAESMSRLAAGGGRRALREEAERRQPAELGDGGGMRGRRVPSSRFHRRRGHARRTASRWPHSQPPAVIAVTPPPASSQPPPQGGGAGAEV